MGIYHENRSKILSFLTYLNYNMINFAVYNFPFGLLRIGYVEEKVISLGKVDSFCDSDKKTVFTDRVFKEIMEYLNGERKTFTFACEPQGTDFQKRVWAELLKIPYGETRTYKEIAIALGNANASRAVGNANNKNPIAIVYPCHRVIGSNGNLVGYAYGLEMKSYLLTLEKGLTF